ncbi:MAG: hypothetical protein GAK28_04259 [Luteibacter sp.]|nr:MAG: hypothetical protein GAK28_04259 [Luteibacter sp.]
MNHFLRAIVSIASNHARRCCAHGIYTGLAHMHGNVVDRDTVFVLAKRHAGARIPSRAKDALSLRTTSQ